MNSKSFLSSAALGVCLASISSAQVNDDCSGALAISGYNTYSFDNTNATPSGVNDCNGFPVRKDLWYSWTAPATESVVFETCNTATNFETRIAAYSANSTCASLNLVTCAGTSGCGFSTVTFPAIQGQSYLLRVGSRQIGVFGAGEFRLAPDPCDPIQDDILEENDDCGSARPMSNGTFNNLWVSKVDPDWYEICVDAGTIATVDVFFTHSLGDLDMFAYDSCGGGLLASSGSASDDESITLDNSAGAGSLVAWVYLEHWLPDINAECNDYSMTISGAGTSCSIGTNYCMANANSTGSISTIEAVGSDAVSDNNLTLRTADMPINAFAFYLASMTQAFTMNPGGSAGNLCLGGSIGRYVGPGQVQNAGQAGAVSLAIDLTQVPQPMGFVSAMPGETWNFQTWFRDSVGGTATSNFSNGLSILFQ